MKIIDLTETEKMELLPPVRESADIYDFEPEEISHNFGDGRITVDDDGEIYVAVWNSLGAPEFVGYVANWNIDPER